MSSSVKKQGNVAKRLHIRLLWLVLWCCLLLIAVTLALQVANLLSPVKNETAENEIPFVDSLPFAIDLNNIFPFMMIPMLLLMVLFLYLNRFFSLNPLSVNSKIRYLSKHNKTVFDRHICKLFCIAVSAISLALAIVGTVRSGEFAVLFGFLSAMSTAILHYYASKQLRHCRRQYNGWKKQKAEKQV